MLAFDGPKIANAAADIGSNIFGDLIGDFQSAVIHRLLRGGDGVMNERAHFARFFFFNVVERIKILYFTGEARGKPFSVEFLDIVRAASALDQRGPSDLNRVTYWRNQAEPCDDDATIQNEKSSRDRLEAIAAAGRQHRTLTISYQSLCFVLIDVVIRIAHTLDLFRVFVRNLDAELLFETHYQLDSVQRVGAEVVYGPGVRRHFIFVDAKFVNDDLFHFLLNLWIGHSFAPLSN